MDSAVAFMLSLNLQEPKEGLDRTDGHILLFRRNDGWKSWSSEFWQIELQIMPNVHGNPYVLYWLERDGDPFGNGESFNVMLAVANDKQNDLLFVGGDFNNQPFSAFERVKPDPQN